MYEILMHFNINSAWLKYLGIKWKVKRIAADCRIFLAHTLPKHPLTHLLKTSSLSKIHNMRGHAKYFITEVKITRIFLFILLACGPYKQLYLLIIV